MFKFHSNSLKNFGFTLDCLITINKFVSNIARACYFKLCHLASILHPSNFLTSKATATHVSALVLSRIDYCNSLLFGFTCDVISHLLRKQNYSARAILRIPKSANITTHFRSLHLFPVKLGSTYEIPCLCYHCHSSTALSYVTDMLQKKLSHTCIIRSS